MGGYAWVKLVPSTGGCHLKEEQTTRFVFEETPMACSHAGTTEYEAPQSSIAW
jgi:hypothetical protein